MTPADAPEKPKHTSDFLAKKNDPFTNKNLSQTGRYKKESTTYLAFDSMYSMTLPTVVSFSASDSGISAPPI